MSHFDDDALLRYRFDTLAGDQARDLSEHLRRCAECTARYADLCRQVDGLNQYAAEPADPESQLQRALGAVVPQRATVADAPKAKATPYPGPEAAGAAPPELGPEPDTGARRVPLLQWLGLRPGARGRPARLLAAAAMLLASVYVGGGTAYYAFARVRVDTQLSAEQRWLAGGEATAMVRVRSVGKSLASGGATAMVRMRSAEQDQPVEGAEVELALQCAGRLYPLGTMKTDASGVVSPTFQVPDVSGACEVEARSRALGEQDTAKLQVRVERQFRIHLGTDKPLYQPGQTIHVRALALQHPSQAPAANEKMDLTVKDPKGNRLTLEQRVLGKFGVGSMGFELADNVPLGEYTITASAGGATESIQVKVDRYALPKFNVAVSPEKDAYLAGETLRATVRARYFFGKPVARAEVHALLVRSNGEVMGREIVGRTTDAGELRVETELPAGLAASGGESVSVQAQVKDAAGQEERKEQAVSVSRATLQVDLVASRGALWLDQENDLYVLTSTPDGRPVAASVETRTAPAGRPSTPPPARAAWRWCACARTARPPTASPRRRPTAGAPPRRWSSRPTAIRWACRWTAPCTSPERRSSAGGGRARVQRRPGGAERRARRPGRPAPGSAGPGRQGHLRAGAAACADRQPGTAGEAGGCERRSDGLAGLSSGSRWPSRARSPSPSRRTSPSTGPGRTPSSASR